MIQGRPDPHENYSAMSINRVSFLLVALHKSLLFEGEVRCTYLKEILCTSPHFGTPNSKSAEKKDLVRFNFPELPKALQEGIVLRDRILVSGMLKVDSELRGCWKLELPKATLSASRLTQVRPPKAPYCKVEDICDRDFAWSWWLAVVTASHQNTSGDRLSRIA